jgi:hypothetical protein
MLDSGVSNNLMPKAIMDNLGLDITREYKDMYSFHSRKVQCLGIIKDLVVNLTKIQNKSSIMDIIVENVLVSYRMFLSREFGENLGGNLQLDLSYAIIMVFGVQTR